MKLFIPWNLDFWFTRLYTICLSLKVKNMNYDRKDWDPEMNQCNVRSSIIWGKLVVQPMIQLSWFWIFRMLTLGLSGQIPLGQYISTNPWYGECTIAPFWPEDVQEFPGMGWTVLTLLGFSSGRVATKKAEWNIWHIFRHLDKCLWANNWGSQLFHILWRSHEGFCVK